MLKGYSNNISLVAFLYNLTQLVLVSNNRTVKIQNISSRAYLSTINISISLQYLSFNPTSTLINIEIGIITISTSQIIDCVNVTILELQCQGASLNLDSIQVMRSRRNILQILSNYQLLCLAVSRTYIGIEVGLERVQLYQVTQANNN